MIKINFFLTPILFIFKTRSLGLRSELIMHLVFLVGAALLMGGFLLLRLGEKELIDQRVAIFQTVLETMTNLSSRDGVSARPFNIQLNEMFHRTGSLLGVASAELWLQKGNMLERVASSDKKDVFASRSNRRWNPEVITETRSMVMYPPLWPAGKNRSDFLAKIEVPIRFNGQAVGVLQSWLSLREIRDQLQGARRMVILYAFLYGMVVLIFGIYLLNRHVVRPTARLLTSTMAIAAGNLEQHVPEAGPREIASLAKAYNGMVETLKNSRKKTDEYILSLQQVNGELKKTRDELIHTARMATVGHLAAGLAHEIGNPLTAIIGYLSLLKAELRSGPQTGLVERASGEANRIDRLVRDLLDFASPASTTAELFDPIRVFEEAIDILTHQGKISGEMIQNDLPPVLAPVHMVRHRLLQVFINLVSNSRDALVGPGTIRLSAGVLEGWVSLNVADNGIGIEEESLQHIFDPFFTTKEPGKGRGLGLAVCYRVIREAGGYIEVVSDKGRGTEFTVRLPIIPNRGL